MNNNHESWRLNHALTQLAKLIELSRIWSDRQKEILDERPLPQPGKWLIQREFAETPWYPTVWCAYPPPIGHVAPLIFPTWRGAIDFATGKCL
jgi:hypothetical protein